MEKEIKELLLGSTRLKGLKKPRKNTHPAEGAPDIYREKPGEVK